MKNLLITIICFVFLFSNLRGIAQTYAVGEGGDYATLNAAVTAYNGMTLTQPVVFLLTDAVYTTNVTISINKRPTANSTNTLTIKPASGMTASINGTVSNAAVLNILGDHIIIDGSNNGSASRNLTITNQSTTAPRVINIGGTSMATTPTFITVKNCVLINGNNNSQALSLSAPSGPTTAGYFNNITIENNSIQNSLYGINATAVFGAGGMGDYSGNAVRIINNDLSTAGDNAIRNTGIFVSGLFAGCLIEGNKIGNFESATGETDRGIWVSNSCSTATVKNNTISNIRYEGSGAFGPIGIDISSFGGTNITIEGNTVSGISTSGTTTTAGISFTGGGDPRVLANKVSDIKTTNAGGYIAYGIRLGVFGMKCFNNFVWDVAAPASPTNRETAFGIAVTAGATTQIAHNTVLLNSPVSGGISAAFYTSTSVTSSGAVDLRNNIFVNRLSNDANAAYAIYQAGSSEIFSPINHNNYEGQPLGRKATAQLATLNDIKTAFGGNALSLNIPPVFVSNTDLHMAATGNEALDNKGTPFPGVITDIDGAPRSATTPDMGAHEFGTIGETALIINCTPSSNNLCPGGTYDLAFTVLGNPSQGNIFTAQLSGILGNFTGTPVTIGTLASSATSGNINITIPSNLSNSNFYRIRVISSLPAYTGNDNGSDIAIQKPVTSAITGTASALTATTYPFSVTVRPGSTYVWEITGGTQTGGGNTNSITAIFNTAGTQQVRVTETDMFGCIGTMVSKSVSVTLSPSTTWTGATDTNWFNAANWSNGVPGTNSIVIIPADMPRYPIVNSNTSIKSLSIASGASVNVADGIQLNITGR